MKVRISDEKQVRTDLLRQFTKPEILKVAKWWGFDVSNQTRVVDAIQSIFADLEENGLLDLSKAPGIVLEYLTAAEVLDDEGNQIDFVDDVVEEEEYTEDQLREWDCFALHDENDPACKRCKVAHLCGPQRIANRPPCYGKYYSSQADECQLCIEASFCKQEMG